MVAILRSAWNGYQFLFEEIPDQRTKPWLFVAKPYQGLCLLGLYLMFVLKWGPQWMKNRAPYNLDRVLIAYNIIQVVTCSYLFVNGLIYAWLWDYKWVCEPVDYSNTPKAIYIAKLTYLYFILKIIDLLDTVFFVLRKKQNQVSFLHIYHHTGMVLLIWGAVTYIPGGHGSLIGVINSIVHAVMYSYYLLSVAFPVVKRTIWIKRFVTQMQILQFLGYVVHMSTIIFKPDCAYPRWTSALFLPQNIFMLVLFVDFYIKTYMKKPKQMKSHGSNNDCIAINRNGKNLENGTTEPKPTKSLFENNGINHKKDTYNGNCLSHSNGGNEFLRSNYTNGKKANNFSNNYKYD